MSYDFMSIVSIEIILLFYFTMLYNVIHCFNLLMKLNHIFMKFDNF